MEGFTVMNAIGTAEDLAVAAVADQALDDKTKKTAPVKTGAVFLSLITLFEQNLLIR